MSKTYAVSVSFLDPVEGVAYVGAENPEEAREKAVKMFQHRKNVEIIDVREIEEPQAMLSLEDIFPVSKEEMN